MKPSTAQINVGFIVSDTSGVSAYTGSDPASSRHEQAKKEVQALVDWANATGGVGGRKLKASTYVVSQTAGTTERDAACIQATEDDHNQVIIDAINMLIEKWYHCFASHRVNFVGLVTASDRQYLRSVSPYVLSTAAALDRQMLAMAPALKSAGFLSSARVGILADGSPGIRRSVENVLVPALTRVGAKPVDIKYVHEAGNPNEASQGQADSQNAVLSFKSNNVNRVVSFVHSLNQLAFQQGAESQGYRPRYAFPDYFLSVRAAALGPQAQNAGALSVSSGPGVTDDKTPPDGSAPYDKRELSAGQRRCLDVLTKQLKTNYYNPGQAGASGQQFLYCDHFFLWLEAARKVGAGWAPAHLGAGLKALGRAYASTVVNSTDYSFGEMAGASTYRVGRFDAGCTCFPAITGWKPLPK